MYFVLSRRLVGRSFQDSDRDAKVHRWLRIYRVRGAQAQVSARCLRAVEEGTSGSNRWSIRPLDSSAECENTVQLDTAARDHSGFIFCICSVKLQRSANLRRTIRETRWNGGKRFLGRGACSCRRVSASSSSTRSFLLLPSSSRLQSMRPLHNHKRQQGNALLPFVNLVSSILKRQGRRKHLTAKADENLLSYLILRRARSMPSFCT